MTFVPGHVQPAGPSAVWDFPSAQIRKASVSEQDNNAYLLTDKSSGSSLLIDAADDAARIRQLLHEPDNAGDVTGVVTTHQHWDHRRALPQIIEHTGAPALAGAPDAPALDVTVDRELHHGDTIDVGDQQVQVIALRGHTPGSVALAWTDPAGTSHIFTGDSLFPGGVGKTHTEQDFTSLLDDVTARLFEVYGDDTVIYPGHGDNTTLGQERPHLAAWRDRGW